MKDLVCVELRKAFGSKMFAASIIIGSALSVATSFINNVSYTREQFQIPKARVRFQKCRILDEHARIRREVYVFK